MAIKIPKGKALLLGTVSALLVLLVACSSAAPPEAPTQAPAVTAPTAVPKATEAPSMGVTSARRWVRRLPVFPVLRPDRRRLESAPER